MVEWIARGYRPHRQDHYSFNLGIGGTLDLDTRVLGDGLIANEPLPPRETTARTKQTPPPGCSCSFPSDGILPPLIAPRRTIDPRSSATTAARHTPEPIDDTRAFCLW
jgi:hypothetical protein